MHPDYPGYKRTRPSKSHPASGWVKWVVHVHVDEARKSEKIFYVHAEAHRLCTAHLKQGTCAYITTVDCDDNDIPF